MNAQHLYSIGCMVSCYHKSLGYGAKPKTAILAAYSYITGCGCQCTTNVRVSLI